MTMKGKNDMEEYLTNVFSVMGALLIIGIGSLYVVYKMKNDR
jgi:hypothetical protein